MSPTPDSVAASLRKRLSQALLLLAALPVCAPLHALSNDRQQPIHIDADRMVADKLKGYSHYLGNVLITQGSLRVEADEVYIYVVDGELDKLIILGQPAKLQQLPDNSEDLVHSRARRMEYFVNRNRLLLLRDAEVWQGANRFSGDHIEYDTLNSRVSARANGEDGGRIRAVIIPGKTGADDSP